MPARPFSLGIPRSKVRQQTPLALSSDEERTREPVTSLVLWVTLIVRPSPFGAFYRGETIWSLTDYGPESRQGVPQPHLQASAGSRLLGETTYTLWSAKSPQSRAR